MSSPFISILMTAYNRELYISQAIESVLESSYTNYELIIVDDCSSDQTVNIAREFEKKDSRVKVYINDINLGDYPNRNKAASYAKGKYIYFLDSDDTLYYFGLEVFVNFTEKFPEAGFGLGTYPDDNNPLPILLTPKQIYMEHFYKYGHLGRAPGSGLIKLEAFNKLGGFSGRRMVGDNEFWFKISRYYSMVKLPMDTYWNRLHSTQESKSEYALKNYERLWKEVRDEALNHPDCPMSKEEIISLKSYWKKQKEIKFRAKVRRLFKILIFHK